MGEKLVIAPQRSACNAKVWTTVSSSNFHLIFTDRSSPLIFPVKVMVLKKLYVLNLSSSVKTVKTFK